VSDPAGAGRRFFAKNLGAVAAERDAMRRLLFLLGCLVPGLAGATCPTRSDLGQGIVLVQNGEPFRRADFQMTAQGLKEVRQQNEGGRVQNTVAYYAHGLASSLEQSGGRSFRTLYHGDVRDLERLDELIEVTLTGEVLDSEGGGREQIALRVTWQGEDSYALAACRYDVWRVRYEYITPGGRAARFDLDYAPRLGLVLAGREIGGADNGEAQVFAYTWIGTDADVQR
jgi:hypothetical protein